MHLIYANTEQNELNIANYINNLNSVAKNSQEYLNNLKVFTCKFYKFGGEGYGGFFVCFIGFGFGWFLFLKGQAFLFQLSVLNTRLPINNVLGLILFSHLLLHKLPFLAFHIISFSLLVKISVWISLVILT